VSDGRGKHCAHFRPSKLEIVEAADLIEQCLRVGKKLLVCGNGGSAADAAHFVTELVVRFARGRRA
jgi:D-sedoheptulose 7-phosphate isomerase